MAALTVTAPGSGDRSGDPLSISLLQGDFGRPWEERVALLDSLILPAYLQLYSDMAHESNLVVAPEYALPIALDDHPAIYKLPVASQVSAATIAWQDVIQPLGWALGGLTIIGLGMNWLVARANAKKEEK